MNAVGVSSDDAPAVPVALGGNRFGADIPPDETWALLDHFAELGGRMVDTALVYADWIPTVERSCSEKTLGRWMRARGVSEYMTVATKGGHPDLAKPERPRLDAASLRHDVELSNEHLGARPALYFLHRDDPATAVDEILGVLEGLVDEGLLIRYGISNWSAERLKTAVRLHGEGRIPHFSANQAGLSAAIPPSAGVQSDLRFVNQAMLAIHRSTQLPLWAYSSQAKGYFATWKSGGAPGPAAALDSAINRETAALFASIGAPQGLSAGQTALCALMVLGFPVLPIVGCRTTARLDEAIKGVTTKLDEGAEQLLRERMNYVIGLE